MLKLHLGCGSGLKCLAWTSVGTQEQGPVRAPSFRSLVGEMNADGGAAALERFCILAKNYKGRGLAETIQQVSFP